MIPKLLHLSCRNKRLSPIYRKCLDQIRAFHPHWTINIYDDEQARNMIQKEMPGLLPTYDGYRHAIQRIDLFRVAVVFLFGGFYLDMDILCLKGLDELCGSDLVLGVEKILSEQECGQLRHVYPKRIANYMFGSSKEHPFWSAFLREMQKKANTPILTENDILNTTGPGLLTDFYHINKDDHLILLLENNDRTCLNKCGKVSCHFGDYGAHLHLGSWRWEHKLFPKLFI